MDEDTTQNISIANQSRRVLTAINGDLEMMRLHLYSMIEHIRLSIELGTYKLSNVHAKNRDHSLFLRSLIIGELCIFDFT